MALPIFSATPPNNEVHAVDLNFLLAPPRAILRQTAAQAVVTSTYTVIALDTLDESSDCTTATGAAAKITITTSGLYDVSFDFGFTTAAPGVRFAFVTKNGNNPTTAANCLLTTSSPAVSGAPTDMAASIPIRLVATDFIQLWGWQNSGSNLNTDISGSVTRFAAVFVSA